MDEDNKNMYFKDCIFRNQLAVIMKKFDLKQFKVEEGFNMEDPGCSFDLGEDEKEIEDQLEELSEELSEWQDKLYAHAKYSVLICFQGMDTSGKDSLIREVFKGFNSRGVVVSSFKTPSQLELKHDYLWRHYIALPDKGKFGVFNRSHYENVLVTRVHPEYILNENIPSVNSVEDIDDSFWALRFRQIRDFEKHLSENGVIIFKFFLNISKEEQRERLLRRLRKPEKNWKFSPGDLKERALWDKYQFCYQDAISNTSTQHAPWFVIPSNDKATARYLVAKILKEELLKYNDVKEPELAPDILKNLDEYKEQLKKEV